MAGFGINLHTQKANPHTWKKLNQIIAFRKQTLNDQGDRSLISYFERRREFGVRATSVFSSAFPSVMSSVVETSHEISPLTPFLRPSGGKRAKLELGRDDKKELGRWWQREKNRDDIKNKNLHSLFWNLLFQWADASIDDISSQQILFQNLIRPLSE